MPEMFLLPRFLPFPPHPIPIPIPPPPFLLLRPNLGGRNLLQELKQPSNMRGEERVGLKSRRRGRRKGKGTRVGACVAARAEGTAALPRFLVIFPPPFIYFPLLRLFLKGFMPLGAGFYWLLAAAGPAPAAAAGREREQGLGRERLKPNKAKNV